MVPLEKIFTNKKALTQAQSPHLPKQIGYAIGALQNTIDEGFPDTNKILPLWQKLHTNSSIKMWHTLVTGLYAFTLSELRGDDPNTNHKCLLAGLIHDIGQTLTPPKILEKPGSLNEYEYILIKTHTLIGLELAKKEGVQDEFYLQAIEDHHEKWDGTGYPNKKKGLEIAYSGRIIHISDTIEAATGIENYTTRNYLDQRKGIVDITSEIAGLSGKSYDPGFKKHLKKFREWYASSFGSFGEHNV